MLGRHNLLQVLIKDDTQNVLVQLFRYTFVGGAAFVLDFSTLFLLTRYLGIHYLISAGLAFSLGVATNYLLSVTWVFSVRRVAGRRLEFGIFAVIGVVGLGLNEIFMWLFTEKAGVHYLVSKIASTFFVYLWNFFARRSLLFQERRARE